ncbi:MAG: hypothetical protein JWM34_640 [Ilumatobacteraceae bacterium]|nr:hypothetical protein [Ilumatobacteraceae bacterium]
MRTPDHLQSLAELELLAGASLTELKQAAQLLTLVDIPAGEIVVRQDTHGREFLIVCGGELAVTRADADGVALLNVATRGDVVGEMALLHRTNRTATVTTCTPVRAYAGSTQEFFAFLDAVPTAAERIIATANERQRLNTAA